MEFSLRKMVGFVIAAMVLAVLGLMVTSQFGGFEDFMKNFVKVG
jgi:hypothetical protein